MLQRAPSLSHQVYEAVSQQIAAGMLRPGERIVVEHLAEQLGVSPTPVREALSRLVRDGVVVELPGSKLQLIDLTPTYIAEVFQVRAALEGLAAELATPRAAREILDSLRQRLAVIGMSIAAGNTAAYTQSDADLHAFIAQTAGNQLLIHNLQSLQLHINLIRAFAQRHNGDHLRRSHDEHLAILAAFAQRDPAAARQAVERHIRESAARIAQLITL